MLLSGLWVLADKQGYTPYGYSMDVPVIVRNSVSYGRGWQLLRSRGEKNPTNASGPCDPPQLASSCTACTASTVADDYFPACAPTSLCSTDTSPTVGSPPARATILFVIDANASNLRFYFGRTWRKAYASQISLLVRAIHSLRMVNTTLPIHALISGERVPPVEQRLEQLGVSIIPKVDVPAVFVPKWGSKWARASFAKLRALALSSMFDRLIVLDADTIVLRNIDHLAQPAVPTPAFVAGYKCYPRRELRAALMVLRPSTDDWLRATEKMREASTAVYDDLGEGSVWRHLYPQVNELPIGYAALRSSDLPAAEWRKVHVLHDPNLLRKSSRAGWKEASMASTLHPLDLWQVNEVKDHIQPALESASPPPKPKGAPKRRARGRRRAT